MKFRSRLFAILSVLALALNSSAFADSLSVGPIRGTSGGITYFNANGAQSSSPLLTQFGLIVGGGAGASPNPLASLGTTTTVLHGNAAGAPTFGAVNLATDVTGALPTAINAQTGTTYTVLATDQNKLVTFSNSSSVAVTLPQATGNFGVGFCWNPQNKGAGTVTITPTTSTINGASSLTLTTNQGVAVCSDGTNWQIGYGGLGGSGGGGTPGGTSGQIQYNNSGAFGGFTLGGDCTFSVPNITCTALNGKSVSLGAALTTTGAAATTLAFGASGDTYTFPDTSDTIVTQAATQTLTNKTITGITPPLPSTGNDTQLYPLWAAIGANGGLAPGQNLARCAPFVVAQPMHWDQLVIDVLTLGTGPISVALYTDGIDATTKKHQPQTLESSSSLSFVVTSTGTPTVSLGSAGTGIAIPAGMNWECINDATATDAVRTTVISVTSPVVATLIGSTTATNVVGAGSYITSLQTAQTSGTWPSFAGVTFTEVTQGSTMLMGYRVASAP